MNIILFYRMFIPLDLSGVPDHAVLTAYISDLSILEYRVWGYTLSISPHWQG